MKTDVKKDFAVSIFFALLALAYLYASQSISVFSPFGQQGLDSKSVPRLIGGLMLFFSVLLFVGTLLRHRHTRQDTLAATDAQPRRFPKKLVLSVVLLSLYIALYQRLGFVLASIGYLVLQSLLLTPADRRRKWTLFIVVLSIVLTIAIYVVFSRYLTLILPAGILG